MFQLLINAVLMLLVNVALLLLVNNVLLLLVNVALLLLVNDVLQLLVNVLFQLMCIRCPTAGEFSFSSVVICFFYLMVNACFYHWLMWYFNCW